MDAKEIERDEQYRREGWGRMAEQALGLRPSEVESQARIVASHAADLLREFRDYVADAEARRDRLSHHDPIWAKVADHLGDTN